MYLVHSYRSKVHGRVRSDDHKADEERNNPQVESFATQLLGAFIVLFIVALLGLRDEQKVKFNFKTFESH